MREDMRKKRSRLCWENSERCLGVSGRYTRMPALGKVGIDLSLKFYQIIYKNYLQMLADMKKKDVWVSLEDRQECPPWEKLESI